MGCAHVYLSIGLALLSSAALAGPGRYRVVDLFVEQQASTRSDAPSISNGTWTAANLQQIGGGTTAFRCAKRQPCEPIAALEHPGGGAIAAGINRSGTVVGTTFGETWSRGFVDDPVAGWSAIPPFNQDCPWSQLNTEASAVNNTGLVAGTSQTCDWVRHGVLFEGGVATRIPVPPGFAELYPLAVNDKRVTVGTAVLDAGTRQAFIFDGEVARLLGTLGGSQSEAHAVSNRGRVVGCSLTAGDAARNAFLLEKGVMTALPSTGDGDACAEAINEDGAIVGTSHVAGQPTGFLYVEGVTYLLDELLRESDKPLWRIVHAADINRRGEIAATALKLDTNETKAVRLAPVTP